MGSSIYIEWLSISISRQSGWLLSTSPGDRPHAAPAHLAASEAANAGFAPRTILDSMDGHGLATLWLNDAG